MNRASMNGADKYHASMKHNSFAGKAASLAAAPTGEGSPAGVAGARPWGLTSTGQHKHRADKEAHEMAMLAASTLTCTSLSKSVTQVSPHPHPHPHPHRSPSPSPSP